MEEKNIDFLPEGRDEFYNEKNDAVIAPDSYYSEKEVSLPEEERYYEVMEGKKAKTRAFSVTALVLGIASVIFSFIGWFGLIVGAAAIVFSIISRIKLGYFDSMGIAGLILGIFGAVFGAFYLIVNLVFGPDGLAGAISRIPDSNPDSSMNGI